MNDKVEHELPGTFGRFSPALFWLGNLRLLLLGLWIGAAIFFSFGLAPSVFAVVSSRTIAGAVVQRTLAMINLSGFAIGILALLMALPGRPSRRRLMRWAEVALLLLLTAATGIGHWIVAAHLHTLRDQMVIPIDLIPVTDPLRQAFDQLHGYSVIALMVAMLAALVAWLLIARQTRITGSLAR